MMDSFSERLKALGFKVAANIGESTLKRQISLEQAISGRVQSNSLGEYVIKEDLFPINYKHGNVEFQESIHTGTISSASKITGDAPELKDLLFLDTETSGLAAGAGSFAFLVGIGRFRQDGFEFQQFIIRDPAEEGAMLLGLSNAISPNTTFVTFNGKSFDIPLLESRYRINRLPVTLRENPHLDLLQLSRKIWRKRLESCALKDLEKTILSFPRTDEDVPGWMIPEIYFDYLRTGKTEKITNVIYHNAQDVVSLAALFIHISNLLENQKGLLGVNPSDQFSIARIYFEIGEIDIAVKMCENLLTCHLPRKDKIDISKFLGSYYKRSSRFEEAEFYWKIAAEFFDLDACIELAMFAEHKKKNYLEALYWVEVALHNLSSLHTENKRLIKEISLRRTRLINKENNNVQSKNEG